MSAQVSHLLEPQVRHTHRVWYASVAAVVIAAIVAIVLMIANTGSTSSAGAGASTGTGASTHKAPAVTQVGGANSYQFKTLP